MKIFILALKCFTDKKTDHIMNKNEDQSSDIEQCHAEQENISVAKYITKSPLSHQKTTKL